MINELKNSSTFTQYGINFMILFTLLVLFWQIRGLKLFIKKINSEIDLIFNNKLKNSMTALGKLAGKLTRLAKLYEEVKNLIHSFVSFILLLTFL